MSAGAVRAGRAYVEIGARDKTQKALRSAEKRLRSFSTFASSMGKNLVGVGVAGGAAIAAATGILAGFDRKMAAVAAKTGATGDELQSLRDKAKELGSTTQFSASQAAAGMEYLAQAGFDTKQILASIPSVLALAAAGGVELGMAADIASDVGQAFGLTADEIGRVADVIAVTAAKTNTSVEMMGETFKFVAPLASATGQSIEEVSAAAGILGNAGIKASSAGTDLKNILVAISKQDSAAKLKELGISITDASGEMRPMMDILRDFGSATQSMTGPDRLAKSIDIFGKISGKSAIVLSKAGDQVDTLRDEMYNAEGAAQKMATTMQSGLHGSLTSAWSAVEGLAIEFGEALKPALMTVIDAGTGVIRWMSNFIKENKGVAIAIAAAIGGITGIGVALITLGGILGAAATAVSVVGAVLSSTILPPILIGAAIAGVLTAALAGVAVGIGILIQKSEVLWPAIKKVAATFVELGTDALAVLITIARALASGQISLAGKILWAGLRVVFWKGVRHAYNAFKVLPKLMIVAVANLQRWMIKTFTKTFAAIAKGMHALKTASASGITTAVRMLVTSQVTGAPAFDPKNFKGFEDQARKDFEDLRFKMSMGLVDDGNVQKEQPEQEKASDPPGGSIRNADVEQFYKDLQNQMKLDDTALGKSVIAGIDPDAAQKVDAATTQGGESVLGTTSAASSVLAAFTGDAAGDRIAKASERQVDLLQEIDVSLKENEFGGGVNIA